VCDSDIEISFVSKLVGTYNHVAELMALTA